MTSRREDTYSTAETISEEGGPPDPGEAVVVDGIPLVRRGGTLSPATPPPRTGSGVGSAGEVRLWAQLVEVQRRLFRVEGFAIAALITWGSSLLVIGVLALGLAVGWWWGGP